MRAASEGGSPYLPHLPIELLAVTVVIRRPSGISFPPREKLPGVLRARELVAVEVATAVSCLSVSVVAAVSSSEGQVDGRESALSTASG
jgi:hypothetical protein